MGDEEATHYPFDHTSIIRTVFDLFAGTDVHLHQRDKIAPSLAPHLHTKNRPKGDLGPTRLAIPPVPPDRVFDKKKAEEKSVCLVSQAHKLGCHSIGFLKDIKDDICAETSALINWFDKHGPSQPPRTRKVVGAWGHSGDRSDSESGEGEQADAFQTAELLRLAAGTGK